MKGIKSGASVILAVLFCTATLLPGCAGFHRRYPKDPLEISTAGLARYPQSQAQALFDQIRNANTELKTIKGIGTLRYSSTDESFASRIAWIGSSEGRIRLEMMGPYGQPMASLAADGRSLFFYSHVDRKFYEKKLSDGALKTYFKLPVTVPEMVDFLCGRIPMDSHSRVLLTDEKNGQGLMLHVYDSTAKRLVRLYLDRQTEVMEKAEFSLPGKALSFRVSFLGVKKVDAFNIPFQINIVDDNGSNFKLETDRVWANMAVDEGVFELTRPD